MDHCLAIRFSENHKKNRVWQFRDVLSCWPSNDRFEQLIVGNVSEWHSGSGTRRKVSCLDDFDALFTEIDRYPKDDVVISVDATWSAWRLPSMGSPVHEKQSTYPSIVYHGANAAHLQSATGELLKLRDNQGDVQIDFRPFVVEAKPYDTPTVSNHAQQDNLTKFRVFHRRVIETVSPRDTLVELCGFVGDAPTGASMIFHHCAVDFYRDIARALLLMEDFLVSFTRVSNEKPYTQRRLGYFSDRLDYPEHTCDTKRIQALYRTCNDALDVLGGEDAGLRNSVAVCDSLLPLCHRWNDVCAAIEHFDLPDVFDHLRNVPDIDVSQVGDGLLVEHCHLASGTLIGLYELLLE